MIIAYHIRMVQPEKSGCQGRGVVGGYTKPITNAKLIPTNQPSSRCGQTTNYQRLYGHNILFSVAHTHTHSQFRAINSKPLVAPYMKNVCEAENMVWPLRSIILRFQRVVSLAHSHPNPRSVFFFAANYSTFT